ncbi:hypothetical protein [Aestuariivirga litoralis]|uniref:hypothetical protein n=1 Tax=Aestuariivirga litoralis TaxID=2650924 RepID=UPI0018C525AE|nr:hypothetical protein [Aestuariivirga litoralis]MBG1233963.1 hypothetical protein [Aestuariivirga litoralis]
MAKKPDYIAYSVAGEGDAAQWTEIGAAWNHTNGSGLNVELKALPLGRLVLRKPKEKDKD